MPQLTWGLLLAMSIPLWPLCNHLVMATVSRIMHHVTNLKSSQAGFLNMTMSSIWSIGLHSHQIWIQWSTFGMWRTGKFPSWMCCRQICINCEMPSCQYGPKFLRNGTSKLYLIKWLVSMYNPKLKFSYCQGGAEQSLGPIDKFNW